MDHSLTAVITLFGILMSVLLTILLFMVAGLKADFTELKKDIWHRLYNHTHVVSCDNHSCDVRQTGNVIVPHETA